MKHRFGIIGNTHHFTKLLKYQVLHNEALTPIDMGGTKSLTAQIERLDVLIILAINVQFSEEQMEELRDFVRAGGHIKWISRKGGDAYNAANQNDFNPHVQDRNDIVVDNWGTVHTPKVHVELKCQNTQLNAQGIFDGGCSYTVNETWLRTQGGAAFTPNLLSLEGVNDHIGRNVYRRTRLKFKYANISTAGAILVFYPMGSGSVLYWGARWPFSNRHITASMHLRLWDALMSLQWESTPSWKSLLHKRMKREQRHRLLHGYPMTSGLTPYSVHPRQALNLTRQKRNAIGIIPHTFCNTGKRGCGFCTFPHEQYSKSGVTTSMQAVRKELRLRKETSRGFREAPVSSIYFGGGTANLSRKDEWQRILDELAELNISSNTEFTLEGAPIYFWSQRELLERLCQTFPAAKKRISIGVQSFDPTMIANMGRTLMNNKLLAALDTAKQMGIHASIDLLANLPHQSTQGMLHDIERAVALNIPHICVYNLVCYSGLGTEWAQDPEMRKGLPSRDASIENMMLIHQRLDELGYDAITLTDFQRRDSGESGRYRYEEDIRMPEHVNWWGIGPGGISVLWDRVYTTKLVNPQLSTSYTEKILECSVENPNSWDKAYLYSPIERKVYWLTRQIKGLSIDPEQYERIFKSQMDVDFTPLWSLFRDSGLLNTQFTLTPRGRYFADSMAGLLVDYLDPTTSLRKPSHIDSVHKRFRDLHDSRPYFMG